MHLEEALQILGLTLENYSEAIARKKYKTLLHKYHPDVRNDISDQEKLSKSKKLNLAYEIVKSELEDKREEDFETILEKDYAVESQLLDVPFHLLPQEIHYKMDQYYKKYVNLHRFEKIQNASLCELKCIFGEYNKRYGQYRKELTYYLFNYLQDSVQRNIDGKSSLYADIYWEYCEKYDSCLPFILPSLYEIATKFATFYPVFIERIIEIKKSLKNEMRKMIDEKIKECQKKQYYPYIQEEIDAIKKDTLEEIECLFAVAPNEKIDHQEIRFILLSFKELVDDIVKRYEYFICNRKSLLKNLENSIYQEIEKFNIKMNLILELLPLYEEPNLEKFYSQIHQIKEALPSHFEDISSDKSFYLTRDNKK